MITSINKAIEKKREDGEKGFTLIELLVVILIIGVLAAIAIPVFLNQRQGAWAAQVQSDIANAVIAAESYSVAHNGSYAGLNVAGLEANGYNATPSVELLIGTATSTGYTFTATHTEYAGQSWAYDSATGTTTQTATP